MSDHFDEVRTGYHQSRCESATAALIRRGFDARWFPSVSEALGHIMSIIPADSRVGLGGSVTLNETGLPDELEARGIEVVRHSGDMDFGESLRARKEAISCPFYLCSSNAITMDGELVNTDGIGNRVAGMIFGPQTVMVLAGSNKLVEDRHAAFSRIRNVAAPANARRLGIDVPCVEKGRCVDCQSPMNICRITTIISRKPMMTDLKVLLVPQALGL